MRFAWWDPLSRGSAAVTPVDHGNGRATRMDGRPAARVPACMLIVLWPASSSGKRNRRRSMGPAAVRCAPWTQVCEGRYTGYKKRTPTECLRVNSLDIPQCWPMPRMAGVRNLQLDETPDDDEPDRVLPADRFGAVPSSLPEEKSPLKLQASRWRTPMRCLLRRGSYPRPKPAQPASPDGPG